MSTFLLKIEPIGLGTAEVESFASFFSRLGAANGLSCFQLDKLMRRIREHQGAAREPSKIGQHPARLDMRARVASAELLSGNSDLTRLTLLPLSTSDGTLRQNSLRAARAWCEQCIQEDLRQELPAYDRLIWCSRFILRCPIHKVMLRTACPVCRRLQDSRLRDGGYSKFGLDRCSTCASTLIGPSSDLRPEFKPFFGEAELQEIVAAISIGELRSIDTACLQTFYGALKDYDQQYANATHSHGMMPRIAPWSLPTLSNVVATACRYQVSAVALLRDPEQAAQHVSRLMFAEQSVSGRVRIKVEALLLQSIRRSLEAGLATPAGQAIPTLAQIGSLYSMRCLDFAASFPELSKRYLEKTRAQAAQILESY
ncbi:hypothetical protein C7E15_02510 [Stenotrophomonas maltophilia]|uniref:TniQ family protein n=1 Tax=Stenotrophomonas maltophilia TaxID=40324 RepID=UPI000D423584|nr:hypothetical protein [Stenotrophomonas maltophilia]PSD20987.1 hypothetical protein C7E15_02510 [Stenotrophomonas maltophilia]